VVERAKKDGSWNSTQRPTVTPEDIKRFAQEIASHRQASISFHRMSQSAQKLFTGFFLDAKQEATRRRRLDKLIRDLEQNKRPMY
jgi:uncharacterized protein YdeI (YjbR/CyaY-like superfamily)